MRLVKKFSILVVFSIILSIILAGCNSEEAGKGSDSSGAKLEILSWWTAGGEAEALNAVLDGFAEENPDIKIENAAVAGGGGANSQAVLSTRLQGGDPPAVFQAQGGPDLLRWHDAGYLDSLSSMYEENGWLDVIPEELVKMNTVDGEIYGLPLNIHRNNVIWYNKKVFEENGLEPPTTFEEFFAVAETLKGNGVTPFALGDKNPRWATLVFETILLDKLGADGTVELWTGEVDFDTPEVREAVETFEKMLSYTNENHSALDWQDAAELVASGKAAMQIMGDWSSGFYETKDMEPNVDYGWVQTPSKEKIFSIVNDSMGMPKDIDNPEEARKFVEYLGSTEAMKNFNIKKGSIPARTDVDMTEFGEYSQAAAKDFKEAKIYVGIAAGSATPAGHIAKVDEAVNIFVTQKDVDSFIDSLNQARSLITGN
ncbi:ABC transporter substrate-binding protein [Bacillus sp. JJ1533]|uniref:ABC transporter substrate-binding protein n=1 Tax=Bacillus sp. JJ1533 TaxID=3122959 RepID=UPI002FFF76BA